MARFINKEFDSPELQEFLHNLPEAFAHGGKCIYKGRNTLKSFRIGNNEFVVKEFKSLSRLRALLYLGRTSKAERAYRYGLEILNRGIITPSPVAALDIHRGPLLHRSYFISKPLYAPDMTFIRKAHFPEAEARTLARFLFQMQQRGILHGDMNLTNILLYNAAADNPLQRYAIIDTNRSTILRPGKQPTLRQRAANLMRVTHRRDLLRYILLNIPSPSPRILTTLTFRNLLRMEARKRLLHRLFRH